MEATLVIHRDRMHLAQIVGKRGLYRPSTSSACLRPLTEQSTLGMIYTWQAFAAQPVDLSALKILVVNSGLS